VQPIDASPGDVADVLRILAEHVPDREVWAFGSRVGKAAKKFSDLDLTIIGNEPLAAVVLADLNEAFRESHLPFKVDVIDWATTSDHFRRIIEKHYVVLHQARQ
jgi:type I restriction enzyme S subunit